MTALTHWNVADNGATLVYTYKHGGNLTITQQKGVKGREGTTVEGVSKDVPQAAWDELIKDIKRYDSA